MKYFESEVNQMSKYCFICNPVSQSGKGIKIWNEVEKYLKEQSIDYEVLFSERSGHISELMKKVTTEHLNDETPVNVIILGGDGTLDEALQGIADFSKVNIGYVPTGSGNDFARALSYESGAVENIKHILSIKEPKIYDLGKLEYMSVSDDRTCIAGKEINPIRYFDVSCGIGFDAAICERALASKVKDFLNRIGLGKLIYGLISVKLIFGDVKPKATIIFDEGESIEFDKLRFIVGMNTCYEGGGYKFAPAAVPDDGYLDICVFNNMSPLEAISVIPKAAKGTHVSNKHVGQFHAKSYEVKSEIPLWVHTDGEVYTKSDHIRVSVVPGALRFLK